MRTLLPLLLLGGCNPWNIDPNNSTSLNAALWDPNVATLNDGAYVRLPHAGKLLRITPSGEVTEVDLRGASPQKLVEVADNDSLLVTATWQVCEDDDPKIKRVEDCATDDLSTAAELDLVRDGKVVQTLDVPPQFTAFAFNANGSIAAAHLDPATTASVIVDGLLNLTAVVFVETVSGTVHEVPVGFAAESVLFTEDGSRAVVLSRSQVAVVDLASWAVSVTFPLTLDPDTMVSPQDVVLASGGRYALVSVSGSADLYVLDLEQESIDLVELSSSPTDMLVDSGSDQTVMVSGSRAQVDVLEHEFFEVQSFELDEPCNAILDGESWTVLYNTNNGYHDLYLFQPETGLLIEYRAENPISKLQLTGDQRFAVATMNPDVSVGSGVSGFYDIHYGLGIFPLAEEADPVALVLEGAPVGLELVSNNGINQALVLMNEVDALLRVDLATGTAEPLELERSPTAIASSPDGKFVISQDASLGQISFLDPATSKMVTAAGFASIGLTVDTLLPRRDAE
ncbi:MAG TPA: hypothetical protein PKY30_02415 [Myxococcota bacterium]|nr:hypothetical protein [Myxococcota bacterium]